MTTNRCKIITKWTRQIHSHDNWKMTTKKKNIDAKQLQNEVQVPQRDTQQQQALYLPSLLDPTEESEISFLSLETFYCRSSFSRVCFSCSTSQNRLHSGWRWMFVAAEMSQPALLHCGEAAARYRGPFGSLNASVPRWDRGLSRRIHFWVSAMCRCTGEGRQEFGWRKGSIALRLSWLSCTVWTQRGQKERWSVLNDLCWKSRSDCSCWKLRA